MRKPPFAVLPATAVALVVALVLGALPACSCFPDLAGPSCEPCAPEPTPCAPCAPEPACEPCEWATPVYHNLCGGDPGIGRDGHGGVAR